MSALFESTKYFNTAFFPLPRNKSRILCENCMEEPQPFNQQPVSHVLCLCRQHHLFKNFMHNKVVFLEYVQNIFSICSLLWNEKINKLFCKDIKINSLSGALDFVKRTLQLPSTVILVCLRPSLRWHLCVFLRYSQFQKEYTLDEVLHSRKIFDYLTVLQCW